ncbi:MAG: DegT/DnrJ/EryC1/StrS family aminotransferase [Phycisphaerae bacterium]
MAVRNVEIASPPPIPLARPLLGDRECAAVADVLRSGWVTQGPVVERFERRVAHYVGAEHAVAVSSGTAALHLALAVLDIGAGDEVIVPSLTFIATANAVRMCGAEPVFAEVDDRTFNIDPISVSRSLTEHTRAIIAVHQFGLPAELDRLRTIAEERQIPIVEDAACALGSEYGGRRIGAHSLLACFSFHPRKVITTGEGGMIVTNDADLADRLRRLRHHGMDRSDWQRHHHPGAHRESYVEAGFNYRLSDIAAAVGVAQMTRIDEMIASRRRLAARYDDALRHHPHLRIVEWTYDARSNRQSYAVCIREGATIDRDTVLARLRQRRIAARHGLACIHREPCYRRAQGNIALPRSERLSERMLLLPLYPEMSESDQQSVIEALHDAVDTDAR